MERPSFLPEKYADLPGSKPVERAVQKGLREGEPGPETKTDRVEAYLNRLDTIVADERGWELLKHKLIKEFAIATDDQDTLAKIAHGLYESEKKLTVEQGRGAEVAHLEQAAETDIIAMYKGLVHEKRDIQERTLTNWLDYLQQNDAEYPTWFRYFVVRNLQKMGTMDKERGEYTKRTPLTVAPFPELNSEALGFVYRMLTTGIGNKEFTEAEEQAKRQTLEALIIKKDFAKLYTFAQVETAGSLNRRSIEGQWVKYDQGSDHHALEQTLKGKGTGWCTAEGSAYAHLQGGDFYVYYTKGSKGAYTEPRTAIRMENGQVAEVRGVNHRQELEPALLDIATEQYHALPGGEKFDKKSADMKQMTVLYDKSFKIDKETGAKTYLNPTLTKDQLVFLYEINSTIEGFGYEKDPRLEELREQRNPKGDAPIVLECEPSQIAWSKEGIHQYTKAYIGPLFPKVFELPLEHLYTSFPEGRIRWAAIELGGATLQELQDQLKQAKINVGAYAEDMLKSKDFTTLKKPESAKFVRLTVKDLGFPQGATTDQIYQRAEELGLELCPPEVGPRYRLAYTDQPMNEWLLIGMKQIVVRDGNPDVFKLVRGVDGLWLNGSWAKPDFRWNADDEFVFRARKLKT